MTRDLWIFGYGSLVWRPDFRHTEARSGWVADWSRRFWQGSTDHRGVPDAPGRVATLVRRNGVACWGMAYRVGDTERDAVLGKLDHRERGGFERHDVRVRFREGEPIDAITYVATESNPNYLGPASLDEIASQVVASRGPSGSNSEYVLRLAESLRSMSAEDAHVFTLAALVEAGLVSSPRAESASG